MSALDALQLHRLTGAQSLLEVTKFDILVHCSRHGAVREVIELPTNRDAIHDAVLGGPN